MSVSILASVYLEHADLDQAAIECALRAGVRGRIDVMCIRIDGGLRAVAGVPAVPPCADIVLQTEVFLEEMLPGRHGTERAVALEIRDVVMRLHPDARYVSIRVLCLDSADWVCLSHDDLKGRCTITHDIDGQFDHHG